MRWTAAIPLAGLLLFAACAALNGAPAAAGQSPVPLDQPFTLKPASSAAVGSERVLVLFGRVLSDSRCPKDVQCIQAGEAVVRAQVTVPGQARQTVELSTARNGEPVTVGAYALALSTLEPVPMVAKPVRTSDYRATFVLTRR